MNKAKPDRGAAAGGDWIHLREVKVRCVLGVHPAERGHARPVILNISLACDTRRAAKSDQLDDAINYELIEAEAIAIAKQGRFRLIETLAERVAEGCLSHPQVRRARVVVDKPGALARTRSVAVEIRRGK